MGDPKADPEASTVLGQLREAAPTPADELELAVARARVAAALFGDVAPIRVGRYTLIERAGAGGMGVVWSAYDAELDRPVALKLATSGDDAVRARAREEGRALAKLSHPNVVPIYDVVDVEQGVFLVMELVKGATLRAVAAAGEPARDLVRAYRQAGEGLAAAHAAGLIHRDFKPDNAILGADGRVRVLDFGLARDARTVADEIAGTPRYMAPEQRDGKPLTPAVDQYALCVALRESLTSVPRWLEPILARGAADDPAARYPSMDDLVRALGLDPRTRWRRRAAIGGGVLALGAIVVAFTLGRSRREVSPCEGGPALIAASWGAAPRTAIAQHLASLTAPYARAETPRILATLDGYASGWVRLHRGSCEAHRRGEIGADLLDRRAGCLARRRGALAAIGELAGTVTADRVPNLAIAVGELPDLAACEDDEALVANVPPPGRDIAAEATAITELVARADVERDAGHYADATRDADAALARARTLAYRPLVARALNARGRIAIATAAKDRGAPLFAEAAREALAAGDDPLAVEAFARQMWALSVTDTAVDAMAGLPLVEAILERVGERGKFPRALLHMNLAGVALARRDRPGARRWAERARSEAATISGPGAIELTNLLVTLVVVTDDAAKRGQFAAELVARRTELLGPLHPRTLDAGVVSAMAREDDTARETLWRACRALASYPREGGKICECAYEVMWLAAMAGDLATTRDAAALVASTQDTGGDEVPLAAAGAYAKLAAGDRAGARALLVALQAKLATEEATWWIEFSIADAAAGESLVATSPTQAARARAKARALYAKVDGAISQPMRARRRAALAH